MLIHIVVVLAILSILWGGIVFGKRGKLNELLPYLLIGAVILFGLLYSLQKKLERYQPIGTMEVPRSK